MGKEEKEKVEKCKLIILLVSLDSLKRMVRARINWSFYAHIFLWNSVLLVSIK